MKTVLDLIHKFDELNAAKTREQDNFSLANEERWEELKAMYDLLVFHSGPRQRRRVIHGGRDSRKSRR